MTDQTTPDVAQHLRAKLTETADNLRRDRVLTDRDLADAFLEVGAAVLARGFGPIATAELLRDLADQTEAAATGRKSH
ncbi:MAG: hypothetical protein ACQEUZ_07400 [Pseudomonadota bacterium]